MRPWLNAGLLVGLVPLQMTLWQYVSLGDIHPDLCLVVTCLLGILGTELDAVLMGLAFGFLLDLFSPGDIWLNMLTKGAIGLLASMAGRHVAKASPTAVMVLVFGLSMASGLAFLFVGWPALGIADLFLAVRSILFPQAVFDAGVAVGLFWLLTRRRYSDDRFSEGMFGLRAP